MFRFEDPQYMYLLAILPLVVLLRYALVMRQKRKLKKAGDMQLIAGLMPDVSKWRPQLKFWLIVAASALLIVMLARPQMGTRISNEKRVGIETIIAMDISNSMRAQDIEPSRLDRSKMMVENLVDKFNNDKIGLIVFAGDAFVQLPITADYVSAKMFLQSIDPSMMSVQGTDIAHAISMSMSSFTQQEGIGRAIIVITDGEDHEGGAIEAAKVAKEKGMRVYVLGVGSTKGAPIPDPSTGDYMKDAAGQTVMSVLNEDMCRQVAQAGGGAYIHVENNSAAQEQLDAELAKLSKKETSSTIYSDYDEQFQAFGIIVLLLIIIEVCVLERENRVLKRFSFFGSAKGANKARQASMITLAVAALTLSVVPQASVAQTDNMAARKHIRQGNKNFHANDYTEAETSYRKAITRNNGNAQAHYNLGNALMAQNKDSLAIVEFENAAKMEQAPMRKSMSYHNMGVICQKHQMFKEAIEAYKNALRLNPNDNQTRYNLELCKRQLKNQQGGGDKNKDKGDGDKDKQEKQKDQQQKQQKQDEQSQQKQDQQKMSKENAEQLLNAAMQREKATQEKMKKAMRQPNRRQLDKNW
ncbi:MAG: VWA domain-containing protein [Prevotella sp.]|nr:VWA domain-containing protein [Prevotella sp.]